MSEMVMVIPVIIITGAVMIGIASIFRGFLNKRDHIDPTHA